MTEGPHLLFLKNKLQRYKAKTVSKVSGNLAFDTNLFENAVLLDIEANGKNLLFVFKDHFIAVALDSFGSILVNKRKKIDPDFSFHFAKDELNFYGAEFKRYAGKPTDHFVFKNDILKKEFNPELVLNEIQTKHAEEIISEVLMNQAILAGVGTIIKTEILYHAKIHPESLVKAIPEKKLVFLLKMAVDYAEEFLTLLKTDGVTGTALIYDKKICPKDKSPLLIIGTGKEKSKTYICQKCQKLFK